MRREVDMHLKAARSRCGRLVIGVGQAQLHSDEKRKAALENDHLHVINTRLTSYVAP
jgi:hypothetical protein